jgi:shikimate dehydrogenase
MRVFGLIGFPLSHSFSKKYFTGKFAAGNLHDNRYENFPLASIEEFPALLQNTPNLAGLNVTIPYKEQVIRFLDEKDPVVEEIGACNCIKIENGKLSGFNTDVTGFRLSLEDMLRPWHDKALVLGTGGAAKAIAYVLDQWKISYRFVSRAPQRNNLLGYESITDDMLSSHKLIINTTPLGMYPNINEAPPLNYEALTDKHLLFDAIYNPEKTLFLRKGEEKGTNIRNGSQMLGIQAEESWKIWNR